MITYARNLVGAFVMGSAVLLTPAAPAWAAPVAAVDAQQAGLVNVNVGNVTILRNVAVAAAVNAVVNLCPAVSAQNIALLANQVATQGGTTQPICEGTARGNSGPVTISESRIGR